MNGTVIAVIVVAVVVVVIAVVALLMARKRRQHLRRVTEPFAPARRDDYERGVGGHHGPDPGAESRNRSQTEAGTSTVPISRPSRKFGP